MFHLGHGKPPGPGVDRRCRPGVGHLAAFGGLIQASGPVQPGFRGFEGVLPAHPFQKVVQPQQPARRHLGRAVHPVGAGQDDMGGREGLGEIMGLKANKPFRGRQAEILEHGAAHPWTGLGLGGPGVFVEAAEDHHVRLLQPGFQQAPDMEPGVPPVLGSDDPPRHQGIQKRRVIVGGDGAEILGRVPELGDEVGHRLAGVSSPQFHRAFRFAGGGQGLGHSHVLGDHLGEGFGLALERLSEGGNGFL